MKHNFYLCALSLYLFALGAQEALAREPYSKRADLLAVYQAASLNDARLSAARHTYQAQLEATPQARSGLLPSLTAGATTEVTQLDRDEPALSRERSSTTFRANLSQPLFRIDRWYQLKAAEFTVSQAALELSAKEQELILTAAQAYFETLRQLDARAAAEAEEAALLRQRDQAQGRLEDGASSITDVYDAQAAYDNARANRQLIQRKVDDAYEALYRLTKNSYDSLDGMGHQLPVIPPNPNNPVLWVDAAIKQNLQLQAAEHAVSAAEQTLRQRKAGHAPTVDAVVSYRTGNNDGFGYSNPAESGTGGYRGNVAQSSIGVELSIPLYSGGMVNSQVRESTERLYQSQDEQEDRRREVVLNTRNAFRGINSDIEQIAARRQSIRSGRKSVEANKVGVDIGSRNVVDVLNAERQLYAAVRDYNDARYDYILDNLKLKQAAGSLSPDDLRSLSAYLNHDYDPSRDFLPPDI
ncbi:MULTISPECIES: TolC family outer membrane protein [Pseudomonas]|nr:MULTISPECIES: TolC family outer membrane protein [Pseudomonas]EFW80320.1 outer membrane efflux protein [Pseudomonas savastanoi pv. glycinea str. B076]KPC22693.1 Outer membrane efflux protein [Pseudomonas savastanoi pv. glycinea]KPC22906.1 Outer membrane efflux protein [Pseudomonas savastanoi pv. glycinea]KPC42049.1 Outer membrane efflux protein [Pseudomonas savastanoi pv. glycinea]KPC46311.1 Outer membrane efflux protein [Pseudomonas savastanoi pv. glycinea]